MIGWLVFLAAAATDYGVSPLVQPGHAHRWLEAQNDDELIGWIDQAWRGETVIDGVRYKQVLLRTEAKGEELMVADVIAVVDCVNAKMGMQRLVVIEPDLGLDPEVPIDGLQMDVLDTSANSGDRVLFEAACGTGGAR